MTTTEFSWCNKPLSRLKKLNQKIRELFDFNETFNVHLYMNEFYNAQVILSKKNAVY